MSELPKLNFEASAYLQRLIGRDLISTEELAIIELVKNAYDAGSNEVVITIHPQSGREPGDIVIRDTGVGMSLKEFEGIFMFAGYSERPDEVERAARVPTGEKGIGRFAADKLGRELSIETKQIGAKSALRVTINWDEFENRRKKFSDIKIPYDYGPSLDLAGSKSGTVIRISRLRVLWDHSRIKRLQQALSDLLDPFNPPRNFSIELQVPSSINLTGLIPPPLVATADMELVFRILKTGKVKRSLKAPALGLSGSTVEALTVVNSELITGLQGRFIYFLKRPKKAEIGLTAGVRLYRDGFRVEPFGRGSDWLGVAERKAKRAGHAHIVPSRLFGFVSISLRDNLELRHTTSRESLIVSEAVQSMVTFLNEQLKFLEDNVRTGVTEPRWKESKVRQQVELERSRFQTLGIMSAGLAHELRQPLQTIRSEAANISDRLRQLGIDDKDIRAAQESIDANIERIDKNIRNIASISSGSIKHVEAVDLAKHVQEQCDLLRPRCNQAGIELKVQRSDSQPSHVNVMTINTVLVNFIQNAIEALEMQNGNRMKWIKVSLSLKGDLHVLEVINNGPGIDDQVRPNIFRRFASKKTGGQGVGLYYCSHLVQYHGGSADFTSRAGLGTNFRVELPEHKE